MKTNLVLSAIALMSIACSNPESKIEPNQIKAEKTPITVTPIVHGTLALQWNGLTFYVDPYGGGAGFEGLPKADYVLITDIHGDHLNVKTLDELDLEGVKIYAPQAVFNEMPDVYKSQTSVISNGETVELDNVTLAAIPMYNMPDLNDPRHPKGRGNGYVLTLGGKNVYISGDTEDIPEMRSLENIDLAFVCMNLPYTMTVDAAADGVIAFAPKVVYPYHYRGTEGLSDTEKFKSLVNAGNPNIEVRLENWYN